MTTSERWGGFSKRGMGKLRLGWWRLLLPAVAALLILAIAAIVNAVWPCT